MLQDTSEIRSLEEARREFSTERKCAQHLQRLRWPDGVTCPRCGAKQPGWIATRRVWQCRECRYQFSVTAGTIFHRSHIALPRWFVAIWAMCHSPKGVSAKQLERELGVSYETAWYMARRIRAAMRHRQFENKLCGIVEIDSGIIKADGGQATQRPTYQAKDVLGMVERGGSARLIVLDELTKAAIQRVVLGNLRAREADLQRQVLQVQVAPRGRYPQDRQSLARVCARAGSREQRRERLEPVQARAHGPIPPCKREVPTGVSR
jgi:transposase-like protein